MAKSLHQIISVRKTEAASSRDRLTALHHTSQKPDLYLGLQKTYAPLSEGGETVPPEVKPVEQNAQAIFAQLKKIMSLPMDLQASLDWTNCVAKADVVIDGQTILKGAPVSYLLYLEKTLTDFKTFVSKIPQLEAAKVWTYDAHTKTYRSDAMTTNRTKKTTRPIVKYDAVIKDGHALPAQTEMITEDVVIGLYTTVHLSGAISSSEKEVIVDRISALLSAVKSARAEANSAQAVDVSAADAIFGYIFSSR